MCSPRLIWNVKQSESYLSICSVLVPLTCLHVRGFHTVAIKALVMVEDVIFRDLEPAFEQLFGDEWAEASPVNDICATLVEYFQEDLEDRLVCFCFFF